MREIMVIVGLGNPGKEYEYSRHNLGFQVVRHLANEFHLKFGKESYCEGLIAKGEISQRDCMLLMPATFMNHSGLAVKQIVNRNSIDLDKILVVCDDFNLDFGFLRLRRRGSDGGHNGLSSIIDHLGSQNFARLRLGIGQKTKADFNDKVTFVLGVFDQKEKQKLNSFVKLASDCCSAWLIQDFDQVIAQFNNRQVE